MHNRIFRQNSGKSKSSTTPVPNPFQSRPFAPAPEVSPQPQETPDLEQLKQNTLQSKGSGYNFANVNVTPRETYQLPRLQRKLTIGESNNGYEQEADRVAAQVVQRIHAPESTTAGEGAVQRQEMREEEEVMQKSEGGSLQRMEISQLNLKSESEKSMEASADLEGAIQGARGSGQPLDESVREPMEREFGADFSGVRVHTDGTSDALNQSIQAKAFTTGSDIFFRQGAYEPGSRGGQELIAHELTHVVQQDAGKATGEQRTVTKASEALQRKVENLNYVPDADANTILGVLEDEKLTEVYSLPAHFSKSPRKSSKKLNRAKTATAEIETKSSKGRGSKTGDYSDINALGRWERTATSHDLSEKTIDTGHVIGDQFFDDDQKSDAYKAENLAPQNAKFNEDAYQNLVEKVIDQDLEKGGNVKLEVSLEYQNDPLTLEVKTLVERGALVINKGHEARHQTYANKNKTLTVPRRFPTDWKPKVTLVAKNIPPHTKKKNKGGGKKKSSKAALSSDLIPAPGITTTHYTQNDPAREVFTPLIPFMVEEISNTNTKREHHFNQAHPFEDPLAIRNPAKIGAHPESGRYVESQKMRAKRTITNAMKAKLLSTALEIHEDVIEEDAINKKKRKREEDAVIASLTKKIMKEKEGTLVKDVIKELLKMFEEAGYDNDEMNKAEEAMDEVYSDDDDENDTAL